MMARFSPFVKALTALLVASGCVIANANRAEGLSVSAADPVIRSTEAGSLRAPDDWDCDYLVDEWRNWRASERDDRAWRFADKVYRDEEGEIYRWEDWLDWYDRSGCPLLIGPSGSTSGLSAVTSSTPFRAGVAAAVATYGVAIIVDDNGNRDSPG